MKIYFCKECSNYISNDTSLYGSKLCKSCGAKKRCKIPSKNSNYKDGRTLVKHECEKCTTEIGYENVRCIFCAHRKYFYTKLCLDCKTPIAYKNVRCTECHYKHLSVSGSISGDRNPSKRLDVRLKMSKAGKGKIIGKEWRNKISKGNTGKHMGENNRMYGRKGRNSPSFGKVGKFRPNYVKYRDDFMKSSWEVKFAEWCDKYNIEWNYEPKTFDLGECTYTPDFYLPEFHTYIEIKGYFTDEAKAKINLFKTKEPYVRYKLLFEKELKEHCIL